MKRYTRLLLISLLLFEAGIAFAIGWRKIPTNNHPAASILSFLRQMNGGSYRKLEWRLAL